MPPRIHIDRTKTMVEDDNPRTEHKKMEKALWNGIITHDVWVTLTKLEITTPTPPTPTSLIELISTSANKHKSPMEASLFRGNKLFEKHNSIKINSSHTLKRRIKNLENPEGCVKKRRMFTTLENVIIRYKILLEILQRSQKNNDLTVPIAKKIQELIELCKEIIDQLEPHPQEGEDAGSDASLDAGAGSGAGAGAGAKEISDQLYPTPQEGSDARLDADARSDESLDASLDAGAGSDESSDASLDASLVAGAGAGAGAGAKEIIDQLDPTPQEGSDARRYTDLDELYNLPNDVAFILCMTDGGKLFHKNEIPENETSVEKLFTI